MLTTPLCELLGITHPIIQAPVSSSPKFVAAACNAGGLGMIQATWHRADDLKIIIEKVRQRTDGPFGANFVLPLIEDEGFANLDAALDAGIGIVSTFWGDPAVVIDRIHDAGALALHTVGSAQDARQAVDAGVDAVVAQGIEACGHVWGDVSSMVLIPAVVDAVPDTPVIAAGGIADGRGLAAALALGANAVWMGTRLLLAKEFEAHPDYRQRVLTARETDTVHSSVFDVGWPDAPHRCLTNDTLEAWTAAGRPQPGQRPNEGEAVAYQRSGDPISRYSIAMPRRDMTGDVTSLAMYAGQGVGLTNEERTISEIFDEMTADASALLSRIGKN